MASGDSTQRDAPTDSASTLDTLHGSVVTPRVVGASGLESSALATVDGASIAGAATPGGDDAGDDLREGAYVGRYVVVRRLGAGAMGTVYAAHDPELDRLVAIKVLSRTTDPSAETRLTREAQALARLEHPNVVAVYDVGRVGARVFVAMAFVEGETLRSWQRAKQRTWAQIVDVYLQAAAGLAAAHAAGLVHRDFKPDNAMVRMAGRAGVRVQVMDFGLARAEGLNGEAGEASETSITHVVEHDAKPTSSATSRSSTARSSTAHSTEPPRREAAPAAMDRAVTSLVTNTSRTSTRNKRPASFASELTQHGSILGTPAYMSPEQHLGLDADARSDQFSLCVALWEALYGARPFPGDHISAIALSVLDGRIVEPARRRGVPRAVHRVLIRGLARDPDARFPSMDAFIHALEWAIHVRRRRTLVALGVVGVASLAWLLSLGAAKTEVCAHSDRALQQTWNEQRAASLKSSLEARGSQGARLAALLERDVAAWAESWALEQRETCEAGVVRKEQSSELVDRRLACLDEARRALDATLRALESAADEQVALGEDALGALPDPARCGDLVYVQGRGRLPLDPEAARRFADVKEGLASVQALTELARFDEAGDELQRLADVVASEPNDVLAAWLEYRRAELAEARGDYEAAQRHVVEAYALAREADDAELTREASRDAIGIVGDRLSRFEHADTWIRIAQAEHRHGGDDAEFAELARRVATVFLRAAKLDEAEVWANRAIAADERIGTAKQDGVLAADLMLKGNICWEAGQGAACIEPFERSLALFEARYGREHPHVGAALLNLGNVRADLGQLDVAMGLHERAYDVFVAAHGEKHPNVAIVCDALGSDAADAGEHAKARKWHETSLSIREASLPAGHPDLAIARHNLGNALFALGEVEQAATLHLQSLADFEANLGAEHPYVGYALESSVDALVACGRLDEAKPLANRLLLRREGTPDDTEALEKARELVRLASGGSPTPPPIEGHTGGEHHEGGTRDDGVSPREGETP